MVEGALFERWRTCAELMGQEQADAPMDATYPRASQHILWNNSTSHLIHLSPKENQRAAIRLSWDRGENGGVHP